MVSGKFVFYYNETLGIPIELIVEYLKVEGYKISWLGYYKEGLRCGWNERTIRQKINEGLELYGEEYRQGFWKTLSEMPGIPEDGGE